MSTSTAHPKDHWKGKNVAEDFKNAEHVTGPFAELLVEKTGVCNYQGDISVFDFACGLGVGIASLYAALPKERWDSVKVLGGDINEAMLEYLEERGRDEGWVGLETKIVDGNNITLSSETYTHVFVNFGILFLPSASIIKCHDLLKPGGIIGVTSWYRLPWYSYICRAASLIQPNPPVIPAEHDFKLVLNQGRNLHEPEHVTSFLADAGFRNIRVDIEERHVAVGTPAEFVKTMGLVLPLVSQGWGETDEEKKRVIAAIQEKVLGILTEEYGEEGPIRMNWVALVAVGEKGN